jgi:hypothetical protein
MPVVWGEQFTPLFETISVFADALPACSHNAAAIAITPALLDLMTLSFKEFPVGRVRPLDLLARSRRTDVVAATATF